VGKTKASARIVDISSILEKINNSMQFAVLCNNFNCKCLCFQDKKIVPGLQRATLKNKVDNAQYRIIYNDNITKAQKVLFLRTRLGLY
jgi:hypothetical protein